MKNSSPLALSNLLTPARIQLSLGGADRDAVLQELVNQIPEMAGQPDARQTLLRAVREREQLYSTAIGDGVALPHSRNALVGLVDHALVVFGRHPEGISYGALDAMPARLFFLVVAPTVTQHLAVLARLTRLVHSAKVREGLLSAQQPEQVLALIREAEET